MKIGLNSKDSKELLRAQIEGDFDYEQIKSLKRKHIIDHIDKNGTPLKKGLTELIEFLNEKGLPSAIATSRSKKMATYYLHNSGICNASKAIRARIGGRPSVFSFLNIVAYCRPFSSVFIGLRFFY